MKLTPQDIVTQNFSARVRGYDKEEVKNFLMDVSEVLENEVIQKEKLKNKIDKLNERLEKYEKKEDVLRDTLVSAQNFSNKIRSTAEKEIELIIKEAELKAEEILKSTMDRQKTLKEEIRNLNFKRKEIENDIINMLNSLKELIESYRNEDEDFDKIEYLG